MNWKPTRKWWAARVAAIAAIAILAIQPGAFDQEEIIAAIAVTAEALVAWLIPNQQTPNGH